MPAYWDRAVAELAERDRIMRELIARTDERLSAKKEDPFRTLVRSIIGQQLSVKAAQVIRERFFALCPECTPEAVLDAGYEKLFSCGLSRRKTEYLLGLAEHFQNQTIDPPGWEQKHDEEIIAELTQIRGIGRWTAEMFLIFNLQRPNVLPMDDAGLIRAISTVYFSGEPVSRIEVRQMAASWEPWRTVATWYLWRSLTAVPVEY